MIKHPLQLIHDFNEKTEEFNPNLYERNDDDIINNVLEVIMNCQRSKFFTIHVDSYEILKNPIEIYEKLKSYEQEKIDNIYKEYDNPYNYVQLKDSKVNLLVVNYTIGMRDKFEPLQVLVMLPRYIDKYYFYIQGNYYLPLWQIVDGSTYNNAGSSKADSNTGKSTFQPIKVFRFFNTITTIDGQELPVVFYSTIIFSKPIALFRYIFAKFGLVEGLKYSMIDCISITMDPPTQKDDLYVFENNGIYISVPKMVFDADYVTQSLVYTIYLSIKRDVKYADLFTRDYWITLLDNDSTAERGEKLLESVECAYDTITQRLLRLPEEKKKNVYDYLLWFARNFSDLMLKSNQDMTLKRLKSPAEYIATLYAMKLSAGIYRIALNNKRATVGTVRKAINIAPTYLLSQIIKCTLVNFRNNVNEDDSISAIKYTLQGLTGIGDKNPSNVSEIQRKLDPSMINIVDPCSSTASNPGLAGTLCCYATVTKDGFFSEDYEEPNSWEDNFAELMKQYHNIQGMREVCIFRNQLLNEDTKEQEEVINEAASFLSQTVELVKVVEFTSQFVEGSCIPIKWLEKE